MSIEIAVIWTPEGCRAVEELQRDVWGLDPVETVPSHVLTTAQRNGGLVVGAFEEQPDGRSRLVGFVFGFVGLTSGGKLKHCSHMLGVAPGYQGQGIGYRLKLAQRERVLDRRIDLITWTFDPLESRNANLNFRKLGATCSTYLRDFYGDMRDDLNAGLPSDRFQVAWHIASERVARRLQRETPLPVQEPESWSSTWLSEGTPILNRFSPGERPQPPQSVLPFQGDRVLIQIPVHFQGVRSLDIGLARAWREHSRTLFEDAFQAGYTVVDFLFDEGRGYYVLAGDWELV